MDAKAIELYLYTGSHDKVIEWLKSEGVKTRQQAVDKLTPLVKNILWDTARLGPGTSLAGTANASDKILAAFPKEGKKPKLVPKRYCATRKRK